MLDFPLAVLAAVRVFVRSRSDTCDPQKLCAKAIPGIPNGCLLVLPVRSGIGPCEAACNGSALPTALLDCESPVGAAELSWEIASTIAVPTPELARCSRRLPPLACRNGRTTKTRWEVRPFSWRIELLQSTPILSALGSVSW